MTKNIIVIAVALGAALGALGFFGLTPFGKTVVQQFVGSPSGSTFNTAKFAGIVVSPTAPGALATSSSILNNDAGNRWVTGYRAACSGLGTSKTAYTVTGLSALLLSIGTTSASAPITLNSFALVGVATIATGTPEAFTIASSTLTTATMTYGALWRAGEYMTFAFNATNTAACTVGVDYIGS